MRSFHPQAAVGVCFLACLQVEVSSTGIIWLRSFWRAEKCTETARGRGSLLQISIHECVSTSGRRLCKAKCNGRITKDKSTSKFASRECMKSVIDFLKFLVINLNEVISTDFRPAFNSQFSP